MILLLQDLLCYCFVIEIWFGCVWDVCWGLRVIDIDILLFGLEIVDEFDLELFYLWMGDWVFVFIFLVEIWLDVLFGDGCIVVEVLKMCLDQEGVVRFIL